MEWTIASLEVLILILVRLLAFIVVSPVFDQQAIPTQAKILIAMVLTFSVSGAYFSGLEGAVSLSSGWFVYYLVLESLIGLALGFVTRLIFTTVQMAGQFVDFQMAFSISATLNPVTGTTQAIVGRIYTMVTLVFIFITDAHHHVIHALYQSFEYIPLGASMVEVLKIEMIMKLMVRMFALGLQIAVPLILVLVMVDIVMGILSRTVPQLNILILGLPMKILLGTIMLMTIFAGLATGLLQVVKEMTGYLEKIITLFG